MLASRLSAQRDKICRTDVRCGLKAGDRSSLVSRYIGFGSNVTVVLCTEMLDHNSKS